MRSVYIPTVRYERTPGVIYYEEYPQAASSSRDKALRYAEKQAAKFDPAQKPLAKACEEERQ